MSRKNLKKKKKLYSQKIWNEWNYRDTSCVMCKLSDDTMDNFVNCSAYGNNTCESRWSAIFENDTDEQNKVAIEIKKKTIDKKV